MSGYAEGSHQHAHSKTPGSGSSSNLHLDYDLRSYLFVINELVVQDDDNLHLGDDFYNRLPPARPNEFAREDPGIVMRYQNGQVTEAHGYRWFRGTFKETAWPPGYVQMCGSDGSFNNEEGQARATEYKQLAVFSCNPLLPILVFNGDPLSALHPLARTPLLFFHPPTQEGISHAVHPDSPMGNGSGPCKYVAGANPSWMPSLVPVTYSNPYNPGPSNGLAGELPIILGLMAFSERGDVPGGAVTRAFLGDGAHCGIWREGQWHRADAPQGYPASAAENPRGFLVTVLYDPENPAYSNDVCLWDMEWREVIVRESRR